MYNEYTLIKKQILTSRIQDISKENNKNMQSTLNYKM